ncbi:MATE family efflux transporter [Alicyclobacillus dauci]|uniref:MATE family efflux transporter n=1 Tax=Alicyclobacillus dauci TaxID=1475485 RepID=A0ABY6Z4B7_9BACL|nr:MATE family efflux transporter [Alicyclobacillus dauci]WAH37600.1 MATE family efflux transporter [Alicyclobacillus dauci]
MTETSDMSVARVTWPVLIEQLLFLLMGTADTFMLSHVSGSAVAAVGACNQVVSIVLLVFNMVSGGAAVLVAQYLGAKRISDCAKFTAASITVNLAFGLLVSAFLVVFRTLIASVMQLPASVVPLTNAYLEIVGSTIFGQALLGAVSSVLRANGFTRVTMLVSLGMNILHIVGNYLFIFGPFGVPVLGVTGVAISTAVSRVLAFVVMLVLMYRYVPYRIAWKDYISIPACHLKKILTIGVPSAGEPLAYEIGQLVMTSFMGIYGATVLATRVYTLNLMYYILIFGSAVGFGTQIVIGHLCGAGKLDAAYRVVWRSLWVALGVTAVIAVTMAASGHALLHLFTSSGSVIQMGTHLLFICVLLEPGRTFNLVIIQSLRAAGDVRFPVMMGILFPIGMGIPLSYFLGVHLHMGLVGVWWTICLDEWSRAVIMSIRWKSRIWEQKILVTPRSATVLPTEA